jgi:nicotinate-nucleotide adenylyltransferase
MSGIIHAMTRRIGIYSGTFDPVHRGHVAFALAAQKACDLEKIVLLPERQPRHKHRTAAFEHRLAMLELATAPHPQLSVLPLGETQFSVTDTLPQLRRQFPGAQLALLMGSDVVAQLADWPGITTLLAAMELIVGMRQADNVAELHVVLDKLQAKYHLIPSPNPSLASSHIRSQHHTDLDPGVVRYIDQHSLYKV